MILYRVTNLQAVEPDLGDLGAVAVDLLGGRDVGEEGDGGQPPPGEVQARGGGHSQSGTSIQITTLGHTWSQDFTALTL